MSKLLSLIAKNKKDNPVTEQRFKAMIYGDMGVGKSSFVCDFPKTFFIDTEGVTKIEKYTDVLKKNGSEWVYLTELNDIIDMVKVLVSEPHDYKTLVIDSLSRPYYELCVREAERLEKRDGKDGTEFQRHLNKGKRLIMHLSFLLETLDMNVLVTTHEKAKFTNGTSEGQQSDLPDKLGYLLSCVINLKAVGNTRKGFVYKTRCKLPDKQLLDFTDGYYKKVIEYTGEGIFTAQENTTRFASAEQIEKIKTMVLALRITDEELQEKLLKSKAISLEELSSSMADKWIDALNEKLNPAAKAA